MLINLQLQQRDGKLIVFQEVEDNREEVGKRGKEDGKPEIDRVCGGDGVKPKQKKAKEVRVGDDGFNKAKPIWTRNP